MNRRGFTPTRAPLLMAVLAFSVLVLACGNSVSFNVTLKESNVFRIIQAALAYAQIDLPLEITDVDIRDGFIRASGSYTDEDGTTGSGSVDLYVSARDGALRAEIGNVNVPGIGLTYEQIAEFNDILTREFNKAATSVEGLEITSVTIVEDAVRIRVRVGLPG